MNKIITKLLQSALLTACISSVAYAEHDSGQGKSQDPNHDPLESVSVAPEPSTYWLFLFGTLAIIAYGRRKTKHFLE
jgi:hypothetical protein